MQSAICEINKQTKEQVFPRRQNGYIRFVLKKQKIEIYVQLLSFSMILERAEYEPMTEDIAPTTMIKTHSIICVRVTFLRKMLKKQAGGSISVTSIVNNDPINDMTRPKKGIERPTTRVEKTNAVLMPMAYQCELLCLDGINSSRLSATGDMVKAYFVNGLTTVVHTAILVATKS
jgi:hypothetical protein